METNNSAIINDVINNGLEQYPGQNEEFVQQNGTLSSFEEEIVRHTVDGKSWNSIKGR